MKLAVPIKPIELFISSSMAEHDPVALDLRTTLQAVGKRYELINYNFIEDSASPGDSDYGMEKGIRDCHAIAMILHNDRDGTIREGIFKEFALSVELSKPLFLFVHIAFDPGEHRDAVMRLMRSKKKAWNKRFSSNNELVNDLELSVFTFMLQTARSELARLGQNNDESISVAEVRAGKQAPEDGIVRKAL